MSKDFNSVRVIPEAEAVRHVGVSHRTWDSMRERGETPPITKISKARIGYRLVDLEKWLDARRVGEAPSS